MTMPRPERRTLSVRNHGIVTGGTAQRNHLLEELMLIAISSISTRTRGLPTLQKNKYQDQATAPTAIRWLSEGSLRN